MQQYQGVVEDVQSTPVRTGNLYRFTVAGQSYGTGFKDSGVGVGDTISFMAEQNAKGYWDATHITVTVKGTGVAMPATASGGSAPPASSPPVNNRDVSIQLQSSRKDAIHLLEVMINAEVIDFGSKAKAGEKQDMMIALQDELTAHNYIKLQEWQAAGGIEADAIPEPQ